MADSKQTLTEHFLNKIYVDHKQTCEHWILCNKCKQKSYWKNCDLQVPWCNCRWKTDWKEHCKQLCGTISKCVGVMYKVKHYVNNQALRMLYHSLINSRAQYGIIAWGKAASCHLQPISAILNRSMRCLNPDKLLTNKATTIYKMQKVSNQKIYTTLKWANSCTNMLPRSYLLRLTIILNSWQMFIHITQDRLKLDHLLHQKHVQTQC